MGLETHLCAASVCMVIGVVTYLIFTRVRRQIIDESIGLDHPTRLGNKPSIQSLDSSLDATNETANGEISKPINQSSVKSNSPGWKCACEGGGIFLPQSLMKNLGGPGAALRLGTGSCYHKQTWIMWWRCTMHASTAQYETYNAVKAMWKVIAFSADRDLLLCPNEGSLWLIFAADERFCSINQRFITQICDQYTWKFVQHSALNVTGITSNKT